MSAHGVKLTHSQFAFLPPSLALHKLFLVLTQFAKLEVS